MKRPTILLIAIFISLVSMAEKRFQIGNFCYQIISETDKTVAVFSCATTATDITIPEKVSDNGSEYSVTTIGIPDFITAIEESGFDKCENLQSVSIPPSVTKIEEGAFWGCKTLKSVHIPRSVTTIGKEAFWQCERLHSVNIPNSVTLIEEGAFTRCFNLQSIAIPNSVTAIQPYTFSLCTALQTVYIPDSVTSIGDGSFLHCNSLKEIINLADEPQPLDEDAFDYTQFISIRLLVKSSCVEKFKKANIWKEFNAIEPTTQQ